MLAKHETAQKASILKTLTICLVTLGFNGSAFAASSGHLDLAVLSFAEANNHSGDFETILNANYKYVNSLKKKGWSFSTEVDTFVASYPDYALGVPEFKISYSTQGTELSFGRKKVERPNFLDSNWNLGVQTAFFRMDPFHPISQGQLGVNYKIKTDQVFIDFFASPLSIPDQNPSLDLTSNGHLKANSPWVGLPPEKVELSTGGVLDIKYNLVEDSLPELLGRHQFGGRFGILLKDISILGMYYNRPSKQLDFAVSAKVSSDDEKGFINAKAKPFFAREHFYGIQAESVWLGKLKMQNGFYGIIQEEDTFLEKFQTKRYDYFFISTGFEYDFLKFRLKLDHLLTNKKQFKEENIVYFQSSRFLFENSIAAEISNLKWESIEFNIGTVYSYEEKTARFFLKAQKMLGSGFSIYGYLNLMNNFSKKSLDTEKTNFSSTGMQQYAALDNIRLGVSYVF